jgi:hypothetical protein
MKLTKNLITKEEAINISKEYVDFVVNKNFNVFSEILKSFETLKKNQKVLTFTDGQFVLAKVSSINHNDIRAIDGPIVRVTNGEYSWRVDGCNYAVSIKG